MLYPSIYGDKMNRRVITINSPTMAIKAARLLNRKGIKAKTVKLLPGQSPRGCSAGVEIEFFKVNAALDILAEAGISYGGIVIL